MPTVRLNPGAVSAVTVLPNGSTRVGATVIAGSPPQWADNSDATYGKAEWGPNTGGTVATWPRYPMATYEALSPSITNITAVRFCTRYQTNSTFLGYAWWSLTQWGTLFSPSTATFGWDIVDHPQTVKDASFHDWTYTAWPASWMDEPTLAAKKAAYLTTLHEGSIVYYFIGGTAGSSGEYAVISESWIEVDYSPTGIPPRRILGREGRSAARVYGGGANRGRRTLGSVL